MLALFHFLHSSFLTFDQKAEIHRHRKSLLISNQRRRIRWATMPPNVEIPADAIPEPPRLGKGGRRAKSSRIQIYVWAQSTESSENWAWRTQSIEYKTAEAPTSPTHRQRIDRFGGKNHRRIRSIHRVDIQLTAKCFCLFAVSLVTF